MPNNSNNESTDVATNLERRARQKYHCPSVTEYGTLNSLTQGSKGAGSADTMMGNNEPNKT